MLPVPFSDLSSTKWRPVLMLTSLDAQADFAACPITSRSGWLRARLLSQDDLADGVLPLASWIRFDKILTLNTSLIVRRFCRVVSNVRTIIASDVCRFIDGHVA